MKNVKRQFIDGSYGQIHLRIAQPEYSSQRPLVCLHMFPGSGRSFANFLQQASKDRIVVAPDFPGYGESDPPPTSKTVPDYAHSVWEVIDALSLDQKDGQVDIFGIHAGAKLAVEVVNQRPNKVNKIILSSAAVFYPEELEKMKQSFSPIPLDNNGTRFEQLWKLVVGYYSAYMPLETMAECFAELLRGGEGYEWGHSAVFEYNKMFSDGLRSLTQTVLLLNPKDDLYEITPRAAEFIQNVELLNCPQWGPGFLEVHPVEVAKTVLQWLSK